jgi:DNA (cytosine-5)-methyltransferase 1
MKLISLFSGIGGFELAAEWAGWENIVSCEINPFGQKVLKHYWPDSYHHDDVKTLTYQKINEELKKKKGANWRNDELVRAGGFPCQPFSNAGKRKGTEDNRHLWPEMLRIIREVSPGYVVGENVRGLTNWNGGLVFDKVQADLEAEGYEVLPFLLPACAVNAPHRRDRIWFIANATSNGYDAKPKAGHNTIGANNLQPRPEWERTVERLSNERTSSNTESWRKRGLRNESEKTGTSESGQLSGGLHRLLYATNTTDKGLQGGKVNGSISSSRQDGNKQFARCVPPIWQNFPTESPVCGGDDGLPTKLDGITFSKWRNESIKGYGNAIVPQLAFELFKAINATEAKLNNEIQHS